MNKKINNLSKAIKNLKIKEAVCSNPKTSGVTLYDTAKEIAKRQQLLKKHLKKPHL